MNAYGVAKVDTELSEMYEHICLLDSNFTQAQFAELLKKVGVTGLKQYLWELENYE